MVTYFPPFSPRRLVGQAVNSVAQHATEEQHGAVQRLVRVAAADRATAVAAGTVPRLRLAVASSDFHGHAVFYAMYSVLRRLDRSRFEVVCPRLVPLPRHRHSDSLPFLNAIFLHSSGPVCLS